MTTLRKVALNIAHFTLQFASAGNRDWAGGVLAELEYIESDWAALWWALGSIRILLRPTETLLSNASDIPVAAQNLASTIQRRNIGGYVITLGESIVFGWFALMAPSAMQRVGAWLTVATMLYMACQLLARRPHDVAVTADSSLAASRYRNELERQRDFHRGWWFWSRFVTTLPGFFIFCTGTAIAQPETRQLMVLAASAFGALVISAIPLNLGQARKYQNKIAELDAMQAGTL